MMMMMMYIYIYIHIEGQNKNNIIKQKMNVTRSLLADIKTEQLQWYGHVQRMEEGETAKRSYEMASIRKKKTW